MGQSIIAAVLLLSVTCSAPWSLRPQAYTQYRKTVCLHATQCGLDLGFLVGVSIETVVALLQLPQQHLQ